ncbi:MAG: hypothetical protein VB144_14840 [Clostridia bacterium]|nr:hypothetical protein [Clostridia bacterium]
MLLVALVRAIVQRRAGRYAEATNEELPITGRRTTERPTARMILDSFDAVIVVQLPDGSRLLSESKLFPDKMFRALGVSHYRRWSTSRFLKKIAYSENQEIQGPRVLNMGLGDRGRCVE